MTAGIQLGARHCTTRARWQLGLAIAWLLFRVAPLVGQQDPGEVTGTPEADDGASSAAEVYSGPAVLSRSSQPTVPGDLYDTIQPFLSLNRVYGTGLSGGLPGNGPDALQSGTEIGFGLRETHRWKRLTLHIEYDGNYRNYAAQTDSNGLNQLLTATAVSRLKRHLTLSVRQSAGTLRGDIGGLLLQPATSDSSSNLPNNEPFSNRLKFIDSIVTLTYQKTRRLSFSASLEGYFLRESTPDVGTNSGTVTADVGYRLSGRATVGLDYSFSRFGYTTFGSADVNRVAVDYSLRATKSVYLAFQMGIAHSNAVALAAEPIDPEIAPILGTGTGVQVAYRSSNSPVINATLTKHWRRASAHLGYVNGISAGNGLVLAARAVSTTAGFEYASSNRWTFSAQVGRTTMAELAAAGSYAETTMGASLSRLIRPGVQAVARFDVRPVSYIGSLGLNRTYYLGEVGFIFSPSERPIALR